MRIFPLTILYWLRTTARPTISPFATRTNLEHQWDRGDNVSTEDLRVALQRLPFVLPTTAFYLTDTPRTPRQRRPPDKATFFMDPVFKQWQLVVPLSLIESQPNSSPFFTPYLHAP